MDWVILLASGVLEAVWATALGRSEGFARLGPTVVFGVSLVASMAGLAYAMRTLPTPTAYAVWVGIGASLGGPTGYAINPARDLGPRIAHAVLPIPGKGSSDWAYSWVPVVGPIIGGIIAAVLFKVLGG